MVKRNSLVDRHLATSNLRTVDVISDGNCYYRAVSVNLYGDEAQHCRLRLAIADHALQLADAGEDLLGVSSCNIDASTRRQIENMRIERTWAGEEAIVSTASYLRRPVHIYTYASNCDLLPLMYSHPKCDDGAIPIRLAFYLPGHYRAVVPIVSDHLQELPVTICKNYLN